MHFTDDDVSFYDGPGTLIRKTAKPCIKDVYWSRFLDLRVAGRPCGSVAQWSEYSHGLREVLGSSPGRAMCFFLPCDIWWLSVGPCSGCEQQRD